MAADYDKLFRPHEGMEAPDDMAAQPFFDPSASFPPAPASGAMGQGAQSGGSTRPGLVAPAPLAQEREEDDEDDWDEEDDW